jgi:hypothetical protein
LARASSSGIVFSLSLIIVNSGRKGYLLDP